MRLTTIEFASLLSYSPHGTGSMDKASKKTMHAVKGDLMHGDAPMSEHIAKNIRKRLGTLPFADYFTRTTVLVPAPRSSLARPGRLWVPQRLVRSMQRYGLGVQRECLVRRRAVPKSSTSAPGARPKPQAHYESMGVTGTPGARPVDIVIVDDVVTRGATLIGAAERLAEAFPGARIRGFAALRAVSRPRKFRKIFDPCVGRIYIRNGDAFARCSG